MSSRNLWFENAPKLRQAFADYALQGKVQAEIRHHLILRALLNRSQPGQSLADIGGGFGFLAFDLARQGRKVAVLEPDLAMFESARHFLDQEPAAIRSRVQLHRGFGENARELIGDGFDMVGCHSVLMYLDDTTPLLKEMANTLRDGGLLSLLFLNCEARAMRSGLQGRWQMALQNLQPEDKAPIDPIYAESQDFTLANVSSNLEPLGMKVVEWRGIGIFSDHLQDDAIGSDFETLCDLEWRAGETDPYRHVARSIHLLAQKRSQTP